MRACACAYTLHVAEGARYFGALRTFAYAVRTNCCVSHLTGAAKCGPRSRLQPDTFFAARRGAAGSTRYIRGMYQRARALVRDAAWSSKLAIIVNIVSGLTQENLHAI